MSDLDGLLVDHAALDAAAGDMRSTVDAIDARLVRLDGELAPLRQDWQGAQQSAYQSAKSTWDNAMQEMKELLDTAHRAVHTSNAGYRAADRRGAGRFGG